MQFTIQSMHLVLNLVLKHSVVNVHNTTVVQNRLLAKLICFKTSLYVVVNYGRHLPKGITNFAIFDTKKAYKKHYTWKGRAWSMLRKPPNGPSSVAYPHTFQPKTTNYTQQHVRWAEISDLLPKLQRKLLCRLSMLPIFEVIPSTEVGYLVPTS